MIVDIIGFIGSLLLVLSCMPQVLKSIEDKHSDGLSWGLLLFWFIGLLFMGVYIALKTFTFILIAGIVIQLILVSILIFYKFSRAES